METNSMKRRAEVEVNYLGQVRFTFSAAFKSNLSLVTGTGLEHSLIHNQFVPPEPVDRAGDRAVLSPRN